MTLVAILVILALIAGGVALLVEGMLWVLAIAAVLLFAGGVLGFRARSRSGPRSRPELGERRTRGKKPANRAYGTSRPRRAQPLRAAARLTEHRRIDATAPRPAQVGVSVATTRMEGR
jgi:hypothetical protein